MKQHFSKNVPWAVLLACTITLTACQSTQSTSSQNAKIDTQIENVKAVEQEEQMEQTDGDLYDQSTLADPNPSVK